MAINCYQGGGGYQTEQCTNCNFYHQLYGIGKTAAEGLHFLCNYNGQPPVIVDLTLVAGPDARGDRSRRASRWRFQNELKERTWQQR